MTTPNVMFDSTCTPSDLAARYGTGPWGYPLIGFSRAAWREDVAAGHTTTGYWHWLSSMLRSIFD